MPHASRLTLRAISAIALLLVGFAAGWFGAVIAGGAAPSSALPFVGPGLILNQQTPGNLRQQFAVFWEVWHLVESDFYSRQTLDRERMIRGAVSGMLASLNDPATLYQEPELAAQTSEHMQGRQGGIGIYLRITDGRAYIDRPIRGGPAVNAGLRQDDEILEVDGMRVADLTAGLDVNEAAVKVAGAIRGAEGTDVTLTIRRVADGEVVQLTLIRAEVVIPSVEQQLFAGGIGYIRISEFKAGTTKELDEALRELLAQQPRGLILDLRNNPGGFLASAQELLGRFYDGVALYEEKGDGVPIELRTIGGDLEVGDLPLVVLINGGSASASEIVAGALRDERANTILIGEKSYGKGSVQNVYSLSDGGSARITFAHWLTPEQHAIDAIGIMPQYVVPYLEDAAMQAPCVADRRPPAGATTCADNQLFWAIRWLADGVPPPSTPAAAQP
jgi:carboxyl-terminal processing protease